MMMEKRVILFCSVVAVLGLISVSTGFGAERTKLKASDVEYIPANNTCKSSRSPAAALGLTSVLTLLAAQIIMSCESGCICCRGGPRPSTLKRALAIIFFIVSWLAFFCALSILVSGTLMNGPSGQNEYAKNYKSCFVLKSGFFATGSVLSIVSSVLLILHYLIINSAKDFNITLGQPRYAAA